MVQSIETIVTDLYRKYYPAETDYLADIKREAFNVSLTRDRLRDGQSVVDIGGGWGVFAAACQIVV